MKSLLQKFQWVLELTKRIENVLSHLAIPGSVIEIKDIQQFQQLSFLKTEMHLRNPNFISQSKLAWIQISNTCPIYVFIRALRKSAKSVKSFWAMKDARLISLTNQVIVSVQISKHRMTLDEDNIRYKTKLLKEKITVAIKNDFY